MSFVVGWGGLVEMVAVGCEFGVTVGVGESSIRVKNEAIEGAARIWRRGSKG